MPHPTSNRRDEIIAVARDMVDQHGLDGLTVRAVSSAAGIGVGTLRHYFPSQRALLDAVVAEIIADRLDESVVMDRSRAPGDRLAHALLQFLPLPLAEHGQLDAWFEFYVSAVSSRRSEQAREMTEAAVSTSHAQMQGWLNTLANEGLIAHHRVPDTSTALLALVNGLMLEILTPGSATTVESARRIAEAAAHAVVEREST